MSEPMRVIVRLKNSLAEGEEIDTVLPSTLAEFEALAAEAEVTLPEDEAK
jgi:hypothetical protein